MFFSHIILAAELILPITQVVEQPDRQPSTFPGRVVPIAQVDVVPQVSGEILEVAFDNGQVVKAGDVLYRLDHVKYEAAVKNAESKLQECKANVKYAELSYERHKKLLETRAVALDAVDNALSLRDSSRAALAAAQADLVAAQDDLKHCTITASIAGKLGTTAKTKGNYVIAGKESLVRLVQSSPIRVCFAISNREFLDIFDGKNKRIHDEGSVSLTLANGQSHNERGAVEYVENAADELTDTVQVYALFPNTERRLKAGGTVVATLTSAKGTMRTAIPPTALLQDTQGPYVWIVGDGGKVARRSVVRGNLVGDWLFIEKGLKAGETIVADGAHKVQRGDTVKAATKP